MSLVKFKNVFFLKEGAGCINLASPKSSLAIALVIVALLAGFGIGYVTSPGKVVTKEVKVEVPVEVVKTVYKYKTIEPDIIIAYRNMREIPAEELYPYSNINPALYKDPYLSAIIIAAKYETDPVLRERLYNIIQRLTNDLLPCIWIGQRVRYDPVWSWVHGYAYHPLHIYKFNYVWKDKGSPREDTFIYLSDAEPRSLDPAVSYEGPGWLNIHQIYETLVTYPINNTEYVIPCLAVAWAYTPDGMEWFFIIRGNVLFYDPWENTTYPLTPEDVEFSIERAITMKFGPSWILSQFIEDVEVISEDEFKQELSSGLETYLKDKTAKVTSIEELLKFFNYDGPIAGYVKFKLSKPYGAVLACLASTPASIVCKSYVLKYGEVKQGVEHKRMYEYPVGTGPFYLVKWEHNQQLVLKPNPYYWGSPKPKIKTYIYRIVPDANTRILLLKKGDADAGAIPSNLLGKLKGVKLEYNGKTFELKIVNVGLTFGIQYIVPNAQKAPFNNVYVRKALAYAIPYEQVYLGAYNNTLIWLPGVLPKGMMGFTDKGLTKYTYNITKAKELLAKAGYPNGLNVALTMLIVEGVKEWEITATVLQQAWKELGIDLKIETQSWPVVDKKIESGDFDIYIMGWGPDYLDPDDYAYPLATGGFEFSDVKAFVVSQSTLYNVTGGVVYVGGS